MDFIFKKTNQLSKYEKEQICSLFEDVFKKKKPLERFEKQFAGTVMGYSYHGLMIDNGRIVGSYSSIPVKYRYFDQDRIFALSVDTMIQEKYRGKPFDLKKMAELVYASMKEDGIPFVFGFPNDNIYLVRKRLLGWVDIGDLSFYILPIKISAIVNKLSVLDPLFSIYANLINKLPKDICSCGVDFNASNYHIEKVVDKDFMRYRYDDTYKVVTLKDGAFFVYKIELEDNIKTAYLIDIYPLSKKMVEGAVKHVLKNEYLRIDVIMYVGKLNFAPINLYKAPKKLEPKTVHMSGKILINSLVDEKVFDINNWNVNLSNFDTR